MKKRKRPLKVNSRTFSDRDHSNSLALSNASDSWSNLSRNWLPQNQIHVQKQKKKIVIACSSPLLNVKLGIVTSLLACCDGKKWTNKRWTTSAELLFSLFNLLLLRRSLCRCRCRRGIIRPFYMAVRGGGGLRGTPGTWGNPLRWGNLPENIISHFNFITFTW